MLVFLALGDAKLLSFASGDAKVPDARYFAFWWNIGFNQSKSMLIKSILIQVRNMFADRSSELTYGFI